MLSYFKANDPYRIVGIAFIVLLIRLPQILSGIPVIIPELKWMIVGESLSSEGSLMYRTIIDYISPLSAYTYKWLFVVFGKQRWIYQVLSMILVVFQAAIFNNVMLKNKAYNSNTYVPGLLYAIAMSMFFDFLTLSPVLMSMTFLLLAINNLFKRMDNQTKDELFVYTGIYLGVATLFYLPSIFFLLVTLVSLVVFTGSLIRRMLLLLYGYGIVCLFSVLYFYWFDNVSAYWEQVIGSIWTVSSYKFVDTSDLIILAIIPTLLLLISFYKVVKQGRYINFQVKIQYVMIMFIPAGLLGMLIVNDRATFQLILLLPTFVFYLTHYFLLIKNKLISEALFVLVVTLLLFNGLFPYQGWLHADEIVSFEKLFVHEHKYKSLVQGKKVWYIGDDLSIYDEAKLATPYLDWQLSSSHLQQVDYYDILEKVYLNISNDQPEVIIDEKGVIEKLFEKMPIISRNYRHHESFDGVYLLNSIN